MRHDHDLGHCKTCYVGCEIRLVTLQVLMYFVIFRELTARFDDLSYKARFSGKELDQRRCFGISKFLS